MKRFAVGTLFATILTAVGACGPADDSGYSYPGAGAAPQSCSYYVTCGACTPIVGCGWCTYPDGTGSCASGADSCGYNYTEFNWNPSGCPGGASSSAGSGSSGSSSFFSSSGSTSVFSSSSSSAVSSSSSTLLHVVDAGPVDAAADVTLPGDASSIDAAPDQSSTTSEPPIIADGGGCAENDGLLCAASQPWGVTCTQSGPNMSVPEPPPALGCSVVDTPTPNGTLYYCCSQQFGAVPPPNCECPPR